MGKFYTTILTDYNTKKTLSTEEEIIQKIEKAFADNIFPGDDNLASYSYEEGELIKRHFSGQNDWRNLSADFIDKDGALAFFSNEAYRFFLPAYMIADIKGHLEWNDPSVSLCWNLTPQYGNQKIAEIWGGGTMAEQAKKCFEPLTHEQVSAIISYLRWKMNVELEDEFYISQNLLCISQALENYWLKRENLGENK